MTVCTNEALMRTIDPRHLHDGWEDLNLATIDPLHTCIPLAEGEREPTSVSEGRVEAERLFFALRSRRSGRRHQASAVD